MNWGGVNRKFLKSNVMTLAYGAMKRTFANQYFEFMRDKRNLKAKESLLEITGGT